LSKEASLLFIALLAPARKKRVEEQVKEQEHKQVADTGKTTRYSSSATFVFAQPDG